MFVAKVLSEKPILTATKHCTLEREIIHADIVPWHSALSGPELSMREDISASSHTSVIRVVRSLDKKHHWTVIIKVAIPKKYNYCRDKIKYVSIGVDKISIIINNMVPWVHIFRFQSKFYLR